MKTIVALLLTSTFFHAILEPFVDPKLCLVEQMHFFQNIPIQLRSYIDVNGRSFMSPHSGETPRLIMRTQSWECSITAFVRSVT